MNWNDAVIFSFPKSDPELFHAHFREHIEEIEKQHNHISIIRKDHNSFTAAATCGMIRSSASYISELKSFCIDDWSPFTSTQSWKPLASVT